MTQRDDGVDIRQRTIVLREILSVTPELFEKIEERVTMNQFDEVTKLLGERLDYEKSRAYYEICDAHDEVVRWWFNIRRFFRILARHRAEVEKISTVCESWSDFVRRTEMNRRSIQAKNNLLREQTGAGG